MESTTSSPADKKVWGLDVPTYLLLLHLSQLLNFVLPFGGLIAPVVMWAVNKEADSRIDIHGRIVINWILSSIIYFAISFVLLLVIIGFFLMIGVGVAGVIFAIIGGIKANQGIAWKYPLSIPFLKVPALDLNTGAVTSAAN